MVGGEVIARLGRFCEQTRRARPGPVVWAKHSPNLQVLNLYFSSEKPCGIKG